MLIPHFAVSLFFLATVIFGADAAGQVYPSKPVRIVTAGIGGGNDFVSRLVAQGISGPLGQPVIVENRGGGVVPGEVVSKAPPDGYTLLIMGPGLWLGQFFNDKVPYDVERDFAPISVVDRSPLLLVVHPSLPVKSVKDLIALARARPQELNYSSSSTGSTSHLAGELFKSMTGVSMVRVPYKSGSTEIADLLGGQVQLTFSTGAAAPHAKSGKLRAVAVTGEHPSPLYPGVPTVASSGLPGYQAISFTAMFAPAKTPAAIIERVNQELVRFYSTPEPKERLFNNGAEAVSSSPEELAAAIKTERARWGKVIREAGIKPD